MGGWQTALLQGAVPRLHRLIESITRRNLHILRIAAEVGMGGGRRAVAVEPGGGADACAENMDTY